MTLVMYFSMQKSLVVAREWVSFSSSGEDRTLLHPEQSEDVPYWTYSPGRALRTGVIAWNACKQLCMSNTSGPMLCK